MAKKGEKGLSYKLSVREQKFVAYYIECGNGGEAVKKAGFRTNAPAQYAKKILKKPKIQEEIRVQMAELKMDAIASANEILMFYTLAMRGEVKDQFGLDASLADRMKAADALAKRQIDMQALADKAADNKITVNLVWDRENTILEPDVPVNEDDL